MPYQKGDIPWSKGKHLRLNTGRTHFKKGHIPWNKNENGLTICPVCGKEFWVKPFTQKRGEGIYCSKKCYGEALKQSGIRKGKNHPNWKGNKCKKQNERNDPLYQNWVKQVKKRDNNICQLKDENCLGYNVVHHIKGWTKYPKLRYKINNGITLCQAHHPRTRAEEKRLIPVLEELASVSSRKI